jgi:hypothetical protein
MAYEAGHPGDYPETAGWALNALDQGDRAAFAVHLRSCAYCQFQVAGFAPVAKGLAAAMPAVEPPADLELKVVAAVHYAAMAEAGPAGVPGLAAAGPAAARSHRWRHLHWANPLYAALAAAAVTAAVFAGSTLLRSSPAVAAEFSLRAQPGLSGSATAVARKAQGGFTIRLAVNGLPDPKPGQFYECWYAGPDNEPGHPELIAAGTFTVHGSGTQAFSMWSAADPAECKVMQITLEEPGDAGQHGEVILSGTAHE